MPKPWVGPGQRPHASGGKNISRPVSFSAPEEKRYWSVGTAGAREEGSVDKKLGRKLKELESVTV